MTTTVVVGSSTLPDAREAAAEAARGALSRAGAPALALVLATDQYDPQALATGVTEALGATPWAGCCAPGVFCGPRLLRQGVVVGALVAPGARVGMGVAGPLREGGRRAGAAATATALEGFPPTAAPGWSRALLVFADASDGNAADVVRGALEIAGTGVLWAGTGVADRGLQAGSAQFALGRVHTDSVVVVALDAPARLAAGISHGFLPYGPPTLVTRAAGGRGGRAGVRAGVRDLPARGQRPRRPGHCRRVSRLRHHPPAGHPPRRRRTRHPRSPASGCRRGPGVLGGGAGRLSGAGDGGRSQHGCWTPLARRPHARATPWRAHWPGRWCSTASAAP